MTHSPIRPCGGQIVVEPILKPRKGRRRRMKNMWLHFEGFRTSLLKKSLPQNRQTIFFFDFWKIFTKVDTLPYPTRLGRRWKQRTLTPLSSGTTPKLKNRSWSICFSILALGHEFTYVIWYFVTNTGTVSIQPQFSRLECAKVHFDDLPKKTKTVKQYFSSLWKIFL